MVQSRTYEWGSLWMGAAIIIWVAIHCALIIIATRVCLIAVAAFMMVCSSSWWLRSLPTIRLGQIGISFVSAACVRICSKFDDGIYLFPERGVNALSAYSSRAHVYWATCRLHHRTALQWCTVIHQLCRSILSGLACWIVQPLHGAFAALDLPICGSFKDVLDYSSRATYSFRYL